MADGDKKERERHIIEAARKRSTLLPSGELVPGESPDWRIPSASLGIEVSELLPDKPDGVLFSGQQLSAFQVDVVQAAERFYRARANVRPADVFVYFRNDWALKRNAEAMARALADFVHSNYPSDTGTVVLEELEPGLCGWVDGLSVVRITREDGRWQTGGCSDVAVVTYEQLASRIAAKNQRVAEYRRRLPGWHIWLLIGTRFPVLSSVTVPREVTSWRFNSDFDRVLLSSLEDGVLELDVISAPSEPLTPGP